MSRRPRSASLWVEYIFSFAIIVLIARAIWHLSTYGYLPQPFFYEPSDTFMDWFNTAYWAQDQGAYDSWRTIYPPLSFIILRGLSIGSCYQGAEGVAARDCDWLALVALHAIFLLNIILIAWAFIKIDRKTALPRTIALAVGMPMLFALERGNIVILCFSFVLLAFGPLVRAARLRWLFAGLAVNLKVYVIGAIVAQLLRRRWLWAEGAMLATVGVYILTFGILGAGTPHELYSNLNDYATGYVAAQVLDVWYSITYQPLISLLGGETFPVTGVVGSRVSEVGLVVLPAFVLAGQAALVFAAFATWLRPEVVPTFRVAAIGIVFALITSEAGGHSQIMVILFVFMERWHGVARPFAIICCYILCLPGDIPTGMIPPVFAESYLGGRPVEMHINVALGMFLRPGLLIAIAIALSATTLHDVWQDVRDQRWRDRWRFRRDVPLLPGVARPTPVNGND